MIKSFKLSIIYHDNSTFVSAKELFNHIFPHSYNHYRQWVRVNITHQPQNFPKKGIDYIPLSEIEGLITEPKKERRPGRRREDYLISVRFAEQLCYQAKTLSARDVREFLYQFR